MARYEKHVFGRDNIPIKFDGRTMGSQWNHEGVTERKQLAEQLFQSHKMESLRKFAGGVHDFNNLLTAIIAYCHMGLSSLPGASRERELFQQINKAAGRAAELTGQMLTFSRSEPTEPEVIDLNDLVVTMYKMLRPLIGEDIELITVPSADLWAVKIDPGQMELVLLNLAANSRNAMPSGGKLIIGTANVPDGDQRHQRSPGPPDVEYVVLKVTDTGIGISEEVSSRIFEPFFTTSQQGEGSGLGLSICYSIVTQNGGHIEVESEPGHTTFEVYLPRVSEPAQPLLDQLDYGSLPTGSESVVIVEDEEIVRTAARRILDGLGYHVLDAPSGDEAMRLAQQLSEQKIHLLLSDVVMPFMDGRELAAHFRALHPETRVLFTSGYVHDAAGLSAEAGFIKKPFTPNSLAQRVREVLDK